MSQLTPKPADSLHAELRALIASRRQRLASAVNAELTRLYRNVGHRLAVDVLGGKRALYRSQIMTRLCQQAQEFGRGFETKNLRRMMQRAQVFPEPDAEIVSTVSRQLSWSHVVDLLSLKTAEALAFWPELPHKVELERRLHEALVEARERLAQRGLLLEGSRNE